MIAATSHELAWVDGRAATLACGIGPVEAAAATAAALAGARPDAVLHVGIAGGRGLAVGTVAIGGRAVYDDLAAAVRLERSLEPFTTRAAADTPDRAAPVRVLAYFMPEAAPENQSGG